MTLGMGRAVLAQGAGALFCAAISFALLLWLGRALGTATFGLYVAVLNLATVLLVLQEGGWAPRLYRAFAMPPTDEPGTALLSRSLVHVGLSTMALLALTALAGALASEAVAAPLLALLAALLCMGGVAVMNLVSACWRGQGRFAAEALWQSAGRLVSALAIALVVLVGFSEVGWIFTAWAASVLALLLLTHRLWWVRPVARGWQSDPAKLWPFVGMALGGAWLLKADVVVLAVMGQSEQTLSLYAACTRVTEMALLVFAPLGNVLLRGFGQLQPAQRLRGLRQLLVGVMTAAGGLWLLTLPWGTALMALLFGPAFADAGALLPWVLLGLPFALGLGVLAPFLTVQAQEKPLARMMALTALALTAALPPATWAWGPQGAALSLAAAQGLLFVWALQRARSDLKA